MISKIHDNLPPIQPKFLTIFDTFILVFVFVVFAWLYWKFFLIPKSKVTKKKIKKVFKSPKFSFEKSLKELLKTKENQDWKSFSLKATKLLKLLLEKKYHQYFLFATGKELAEILDNKKIDDKIKKELKLFFQIIDPIKFARKNPEEEDLKNIIKILKDFHKNKK